jgi:hypothetical protein
MAPRTTNTCTPTPPNYQPLIFFAPSVSLSRQIGWKQVMCRARDIFSPKNPKLPFCTNPKSPKSPKNPTPKYRATRRLAHLWQGDPPSATHLRQPTFGNAPPVTQGSRLQLPPPRTSASLSSKYYLRFRPYPKTEAQPIDTLVNSVDCGSTSA